MHLKYKIYKAKRRLKFCKNLQGHIDEFRYRPKNGGYLELIEKYKMLYYFLKHKDIIVIIKKIIIIMYTFVFDPITLEQRGQLEKCS